jgi:hypothetical protein
MIQQPVERSVAVDDVSNVIKKERREEWLKCMMR